MGPQGREQYKYTQKKSLWEKKIEEQYAISFPIFFCGSFKQYFCGNSDTLL